MANNPEDDRYAYNPSEEEFQQKLEQFDNSTTRAESDKKPGRLESYRQKSEDAKAKLREAENADWNDPANGFYKPSEKAQTRINNWRNWSSRRKLAVGGGAAKALFGDDALGRLEEHLDRLLGAVLPRRSAWARDVPSRHGAATILDDASAREVEPSTGARPPSANRPIFPVPRRPRGRREVEYRRHAAGAISRS